MFSNGPLDFFYAAHNQMASTGVIMTFSLTDLLPRAVRRELITPNPKLKLTEQIREVLRLKNEHEGIPGAG